MGTATVDSPRTTRRSRARRRQPRSPEPRPPASSGGGALLTIRPAPPLDPPFDSNPQPPAGMELLPVDWSPADTERRQAAAARRRAAKTAAARALPAAARAPRTAAALASEVTARAAIQRFVGMCVEVLNGYRPATHLRPVTDFRHYNDV